MSRFGFLRNIFVSFPAVFSLILLPFVVFTQNETACLVINGKYELTDTPIDIAIVSVYSNDRIIQIYETKKNGEFVLTLPFQQDFQIRIDKPGLLSLFINLSTYMPQSKAIKTIMFTFENIKAIVSSEIQDINKIELIPYTYIAYDVSKGNFTENSEQIELFKQSIINATIDNSSEN